MENFGSTEHESRPRTSQDSNVQSQPESAHSTAYRKEGGAAQSQVNKDAKDGVEKYPYVRDTLDPAIKAQLIQQFTAERDEGVSPPTKGTLDEALGQGFTTNERALRRKKALEEATGREVDDEAYMNILDQEATNNGFQHMMLQWCEGRDTVAVEYLQEYQKREDRMMMEAIMSNERNAMVMRQMQENAKTLEAAYLVCMEHQSLRQDRDTARARVRSDREIQIKLFHQLSAASDSIPDGSDNVTENCKEEMRDALYSLRDIREDIDELNTKLFNFPEDVDKPSADMEARTKELARDIIMLEGQTLPLLESLKSQVHEIEKNLPVSVVRLLDIFEDQITLHIDDRIKSESRVSAHRKQYLQALKLIDQLGGLYMGSIEYHKEAISPREGGLSDSTQSTESHHRRSTVEISEESPSTKAAPNLASKELGELRSKLRYKEKEHEVFIEEIRGLKARQVIYNEMADKYEEETTGRREAEEALVTTRESFAITDAKLKTLKNETEGRIEMLEEQLQEVREITASQEAEISKLREKLEVSQTELEATVEKSKAAKAMYRDAEVRIGQLQQELAVISQVKDNALQDLASLQQQVADGEVALKKPNETFRKATTDLTKARLRLQELTLKNAKAEANLKEAEKKVQDLSKRLEISKQNNSTTTDELSELDMTNRRLQVDMEIARKEADQLRAELQECQTRRAGELSTPGANTSQSEILEKQWGMTRQQLDKIVKDMGFYQNIDVIAEKATAHDIASLFIKISSATQASTNLPTQGDIKNFWLLAAIQSLRTSAARAMRCKDWKLASELLGQAFEWLETESLAVSSKTLHAELYAYLLQLRLLIDLHYGRTDFVRESLAEYEATFKGELASGYDGLWAYFHEKLDT
jgi:hypothetical protein